MSLEQIKDEDSLKTLRNKLKGNLGKAFTVMFACKVLTFRKNLKEAGEEAENDEGKSLKDKVQEVEESFYEEIAKGFETIKELGETENGNLNVEGKLREAFKADNLQGNPNGALTALTNMERFSTGAFGEKWGVIEYCLSIKEMSRLLNKAVWKSGRLGQTAKPGRTKNHNVLKEFMAVGWKDGPFTITTKGTLYLPLRTVTSTEIGNEDVFLPVSGVISFSSLLFSDVFYSGNEDIVLRDAKIRELRLIAKEGRRGDVKPFSISDLLGSMVYKEREGEYGEISYWLDVNEFEGLLNIAKQDFWRTLFPSEGNKLGNKVEELMELGVIVNEEGERMENDEDADVGDVATEIAEILNGRQKSRAGLVSMAYSFAKFYKNVAKAKGMKVEEISDLRHLSDEQLNDLKSAADDAIKRAETALDNYKEMIQELRLKSIRENTDKETLNGAVASFYEGNEEVETPPLNKAIEEIREHLENLCFKKKGGRWKPKGILPKLKDMDIGKRERKDIKRALEEKTAEIDSDIDELVSNGEKNLENTFKITKLMHSLISSTKNIFSKELGDLAEQLEKQGDEEKAEKVDDIKDIDLRIGGDLYDRYLKKAFEAVGTQQNVIYSKTYTKLPSTLKALSMLYRSSITVNGNHYTSIPNPSYIGDMAVAWNQVLRMIGGDRAASAKNTYDNLKIQLNGVMRAFFNSNAFLTESFARSLLLNLHGIWQKEKRKEGNLSETEKVINRIVSGKEYTVGSQYYHHYKRWSPLKRFNYFVGYWFVGEKDYADKGRDLLDDLGGDRELAEKKMEEAISSFKQRMSKGTKIGSAMRHLFGEVLAENFSQVNAQVMISAGRLAQADDMEESSLAITRLAYSQDAYKAKSRLGTLFVDAIRAIRNTKEKMRQFETKDPMNYSYKELMEELKQFKSGPNNQYECGHIVERIRDTGIDRDNRKKYFSEFNGLFYSVKYGFINAGGVIPSFRKKKAKHLLNYIENGKLIEDAKERVDANEKNEKIEANKGEIKKRLKNLIESRTLLVKNGEFGVMGLSNQAELLAMALRTRALGMIAGRVGKKIDINVGESFTWCTSGLQTLSQHMSEEKVKEIAKRKSIKDIRELALTVMERETLSTLFRGKKKGEALSNDNTIEQLKRLIVVKDPEGKGKKLNDLQSKLSKETCEDIVSEVKDTALRLESAIKRDDNGKIIKELTPDGKAHPVLTDKAKKQIERGLRRKGFPERAANKMSKNLEEAIQKEMARRLAARKLQYRKRTTAKFFMALTPIGAIGLMVKKVIDWVMSNTRCSSLLQNALMGKAVQKLKHGKVGSFTKKYISNLIQNFYTGFIVGLMSFLGMVIGTLVVRLTTDAQGLKDFLNGSKSKDKDLGDALRENSPVLGFLWIKLPTIAWIIISAVLFPLMLVLISQKYLMDISSAKGGAAIFTGVTGIWAYASMNGKGWFDSIPFFVSLSGMLWIWDEFDDFQDAKEQMGNNQGGGAGLVDYAELFLLPFVLGFFGAMFGMADPMALVIPGKLGFMKYTTGALPKPWNWILHALYRVVATVVGGIVASGGVGGFAIYMIGSVLANFAMRGS